MNFLRFLLTYSLSYYITNLNFIAKIFPLCLPTSLIIDSFCCCFTYLFALLIIFHQQKLLINYLVIRLPATDAVLNIPSHSFAHSSPYGYIFNRPPLTGEVRRQREIESGSDVCDCAPSW